MDRWCTYTSCICYHISTAAAVCCHQLLFTHCYGLVSVPQGRDDMSHSSTKYRSTNYVLPCTASHIDSQPPSPFLYTACTTRNTAFSFSTELLFKTCQRESQCCPELNVPKQCQQGAAGGGMMTTARTRTAGDSSSTGSCHRWCNQALRSSDPRIERGIM